MTHDEMQTAERLDRHWDAIVAGRKWGEVSGSGSTGQERLIRRIHASRPSGPSDAARSRIWQAALARSSEEVTQMTDAQALRPSVAPLAEFEPARRARLWRPALEIAAALLIVAIIGGYFAAGRFLPSDGEGNNFGAAGTPAAVDGTPAVTGDIPLPGECTVDPRSIESLEQILASPATGATQAMDFQPGDGELADDETAAAVTATMRELAACFNLEDPLRVYALFTDEALRGGLTPEALEDARRGEPMSPNFDYPLPVVWDVRVQPDGRVTAKVDFNGERVLITFILSPDGERWLIDRWNDQVAFYDSPATPVP